MLSANPQHSVCGNLGGATPDAASSGTGWLSIHSLPGCGRGTQRGAVPSSLHGRILFKISLCFTTPGLSGCHRMQRRGGFNSKTTLGSFPLSIQRNLCLQNRGHSRSFAGGHCLAFPRASRQPFTLQLHTKGLGWLPLITVSPELTMCLAKDALSKYQLHE